MTKKRSYRDLYLFCSRLMDFIYWDFNDGSCPSDQYEEILDEWNNFAVPRGDRNDRQKNHKR